MLLGARGYTNNADFEKKKIVNDNIVLDVFIICQKSRQVLWGITLKVYEYEYGIF